MGLRILHTADWHMDAPLTSFSEERREVLRRAQLAIPEKTAQLCRQENCNLVLLAGDVFDGIPGREAVEAVKRGLAECGVPVFVSPGNHDFCGAGSPWLEETWPDNVTVFTGELTSVAVPGRNCRVYGAGYRSMDCAALLDGFHAQGEEAYQIGLLHSDPVTAGSPYCPITAGQVRGSGLSYLALGHIHKGDSFKNGNTLCAWPGCPMGTGFDEQGIKGVYIVDVQEEASCRFAALDVPRFYDLEVAAGEDPASALASVLPGSGSEDFYRVTLIGESETPDLEKLKDSFSVFPNLLLRDRTTAPVDIWAGAGEDSFEGVYFGMLKEALNSASCEEKEKILLAATLSRKILSGEEVALP